MARPLRVEFENAIYHLCARGNARQVVFHDEQDRVRFVKLLGESAQRFDAGILCFVLMSNHFHLVAQTHRPNLRRWMHWLLVSYTVYFNRRHRSGGHLFQGRYKSFLVQEGDYLLGLSRYVHLNPVRGVSLGRGSPRDRRKRLRDFGWSSYPGYAGIKAQYPFVEEEMVLGELSGARRTERLRYRRFVEEGLLREIENPFEAVRWQAVLEQGKRGHISTFDIQTCLVIRREWPGRCEWSLRMPFIICARAAMPGSVSFWMIRIA